MFICPNCKEEYREGFTVCADCGEKIILVPDSPQEEYIKEDIIFSEPTFLHSINDGINADILIATLKNNEIPVMLKRIGMGEYLKIYMNMNAFGVEIYVPAVMLEKSKEILNNIIFTNNSTEEIDNEFQAEVTRAEKNKMIKGWLLLSIFLGLPSFIVLILWLLSQ